MNKLLIYFLSSIIVLLSLLIAFRFFIFSEVGNTTVKTYLQSTLKEQLSMPVKVYDFSLDEKKMKFSININESMQIDVITQYNMLTQYFAGVYYLKAKNFEYEGFHLRDANLSGRFKGRRNNMQIQGQGELLAANLVYRFHLKNKSFKHIEAKIKGLKSKEIFGIISEDPLFFGVVDLDINLPKLGKDIAKGSGTIVLHKALFDIEHIKNTYDISLPPLSAVSGRIDMKLEGKKLLFSSHSQSNIFTLAVEDAIFDVDKNHLDASYVLNMKNLELFTKNTLLGAFSVKGTMLAEQEKYKILGHSSSWGGSLGFEISETSSLKLENIHLDKLLYAMKKLPYAKGLVSGDMTYFKEGKKGQYTLNISQGIFLADTIDKALGYQIPSMNTFGVQSHGFIRKDVIDFQTNLKSSIVDIALKDANYDIYQQKLQTNYTLFLPNMGLILPNNKAVKRGYISAKGHATFDDTLNIHGKANGLGGSIDFVYDDNQAKIEAPEVFIQKIFSLASLSRYFTGKIKTKIALNDVRKQEGNFSFSSDNLRTQARMIEKLLGKKIAIKMRLKSEGEIKEGNITASTSLESDIANLYLNQMHIDSQEKRLNSPYILDIPELKNAYALIGKKLYGPMKFRGKMSYGEILKIEGKTDSLGGEIFYQWLDKNITSQIKKVSLENILLLLGHEPIVGGEVLGAVRYHLKTKEGEVQIVIHNFHLNRSSQTAKLKLLIGKDPTRILYTDTTFSANINGDITEYTLHALGTHSSITIQGILDKSKDSHKGTFTFVYEEYEIEGNITGSIAKPKLNLDFSAIMDNQMGEKIQNKLNHALGDDMGKAIGGFLKGLKL